MVDEGPEVLAGGQRDRSPSDRREDDGRPGQRQHELLLVDLGVVPLDAQSLLFEAVELPVLGIWRDGPRGNDNKKR